MNRSLQNELQEIVDEVVPPLLDMNDLMRLVAMDEDPGAFDGECHLHDGCRPIFEKRLP
jgi:hypothetical protein